MTICDCEGTGQCEGKYAGSSGGCLRVSRGANLNIYGGTYTNLAKAKTEYGGAVVILTNTAYTGTAAGSAPYGCTFNFYGGTITGGQTTGSGGNLNVYSDSCIFNMYGGIIEKGQADDNGGNIQSYGTVNLLGGTICGGDAAKNGDDVYINGGTLTIGGDIQIGSIYLNGKSFKIHSSGLNTTTTPIEIVGTGEFATNVVDDLSACFTAAGEIVYDAAKKTLTIIQ